MNMMLFGIIAIIVVVVCIITIIIINKSPLDGSYKLYTQDGKEVGSTVKLSITIKGMELIVKEHSKEIFTLKKTETKEQGNDVYELNIPKNEIPFKVYLQDNILTFIMEDSRRSRVLTFKKVSDKQLTQDEIYKL